MLSPFSAGEQRRRLSLVGIPAFAGMTGAPYPYPRAEAESFQGLGEAAR